MVGEDHRPEPLDGESRPAPLAVWPAPLRLTLTAPLRSTCPETSNDMLPAF
jgi:hypothetical protein